MPDVFSIEQLEGQDRAAAFLVRESMEAAKPRHDQLRVNWDRRYARYRSYQEWRETWEQSPRDRDGMLKEAQREWGADLVIPYAYRAVEVHTAKTMGRNPIWRARPLPLPGSKESDLLAQAESVQAVQLTLAQQARAMKIRLTWHDVEKSGYIYGLGIQKVSWKKAWRESPTLKLNPYFNTGGDHPEFIPADSAKTLVYDDPFAECIDLFDAFWSPRGWDRDTLAYFIHRAWREDLYVRTMVKSKAWRCGGPDGNDPSCPWTLEDMLSSRSPNAYQDAHDNRERASGNTRDGRPPRKPGRVHEVWEHADGSRVISLLNGIFPVIDERNVFWHGELPYHFFRPTRVPHELMGIGVIEPIEHLTRELDTLRSQRRDNATIKLNAPYAYYNGLVEREDLKFGPGIGIPVDGDPRSVLFPIPVGDIPASGYQEEDRLKADIEAVSGMEDQQASLTMDGTATGATLMYQSTNMMIAAKSLLFVEEVAIPTGEQILALNGQKLRNTRVVEGPPKPDAEADQRWSYYRVNPMDFKGMWRLELDPQDLQPANVAQDRQDAVQLLTLLRDAPGIDNDALIEHVLRLFELPNATTFLLPKQEGPDPQLLQSGLEKLVALGVPHEMVDMAMRVAQSEIDQQAPAPGADQQDKVAVAGTPGGAA